MVAKTFLFSIFKSILDFKLQNEPTTIYEMV